MMPSEEGRSTQQQVAELVGDGISQNGQQAHLAMASTRSKNTWRDRRQQKEQIPGRCLKVCRHRTEESRTFSTSRQLGLEVGDRALHPLHFDMDFTEDPAGLSFGLGQDLAWDLSHVVNEHSGFQIGCYSLLREERLSEARNDQG